MRMSSYLLLLFLVALCAVAAPADAAPAGSSAKSSEAAATADRPVDVNAASEAELTSVPGIGESLARRIVEFREKNGPFKAVDDLLKVQGIGEKSLPKLRPYLTVGKAR